MGLKETKKHLLRAVKFKDEQIELEQRKYFRIIQQIEQFYEKCKVEVRSGDIKLKSNDQNEYYLVLGAKFLNKYSLSDLPNILKETIYTIGTVILFSTKGVCLIFSALS